MQEEIGIMKAHGKLFRWIGRSDLDAIRSLIEADAGTVNAVDSRGRPALLLTIRERKYEIAKLLLSEGACVDARGPSGETALHYPCSVEIATLLLDAGADLEARDSRGRTPLHWSMCSAQECLDGAKFLIEHGAEIEASDSQGCTPLHLAVSMPPIAYTNFEAAVFAPKLIRLLLHHGADVNAIDIDGRTPLHLAAYRGLETECELLLNHGADVNPVNKNGFTPLDLCYRSLSEGWGDCTGILRERGGVNVKKMFPE
jgi:ankyrin repeat protein